MKCPRCHAAITAQPGADGVVVCRSCGARMRARSAIKTDRTADPAHAMSAAASVGDSSPDFDSLLAHLDMPAAGPAGLSSPGASREAVSPQRRPGAAHASAPQAAPPAAAIDAEVIYAEIRALRRTQEEILDLLRARASTQSPAIASPVPLDAETEIETPRPVVRSGRRKSVLVIDDDPGTRDAAVHALKEAEVPVRAESDGGTALAAIALEKPDVIAIELELSGDMAGKDVINMIKATMEWVDIPIVFYTRAHLEDQREAVTIHGADYLVRKGPEGPADLVKRVISIFRGPAPR